tara:strand:- start:119 stop:382 length:264 start_codon:yes stop_codon:yes gene_type:complete
MLHTAAENTLKKTNKFIGVLKRLKLIINNLDIFLEISVNPFLMQSAQAQYQYATTTNIPIHIWQYGILANFTVKLFQNIPHITLRYV